MGAVETHSSGSSSSSSISGLCAADGAAATCIRRANLGKLVSTCVIYFHANACDIGNCTEDMVTFRDGALGGDAVILCPEYPGYGLLREFEASPIGIERVADAAWQYCRKQLGFKASQIMLFGRSIGTGPATSLAHAQAAKAVLDQSNLRESEEKAYERPVAPT